MNERRDEWIMRCIESGNSPEHMMSVVADINTPDRMIWMHERIPLDAPYITWGPHGPTYAAAPEYPELPDDATVVPLPDGSRLRRTIIPW